MTLTSGEQLIGKLVKVVSGTVTFQSDALGSVSVPIAKVKTLNAAGFAALSKSDRLAPHSHDSSIPVGDIAIENSTVHMTAAGSASTPRVLPVQELATVIDAKSLHRELQGERNLLYGWTGTITLGATLANATNTSQTYSGAVSAIRSIPTVPVTTPLSKTSFNLNGTYGLAKDPEIVSGGTVIQYPSVTKTNILHGAVEYDRYTTPRFFLLANASADHNFGNGLELQQSYGAGAGWTVLHRPNSTLDLKLALQYVEQQFYNGIYSGLGTPNENLIGLSTTETWNRTLAHNVKFMEYVTLTPTFNFVQAYSAVANANLSFPVYKKINVTLSSTDNYLGDPAQGYRRNSFQFTAGVTYVVK